MNNKFILPSLDDAGIPSSILHLFYWPWQLWQVSFQAMTMQKVSTSMFTIWTLYRTGHLQYTLTTLIIYLLQKGHGGVNE